MNVEVVVVLADETLTSIGPEDDVLPNESVTMKQ